MADFLRNTFGLEGKRCLITGASSGFGVSFAWTYAKAGASVIALLARREERLHELRDAIRAQHPNCTVVAVKCDVGDVQSIRSAFDAALKATNGEPYDVIVNNAGIGPASHVTKVTQESFDAVMNVNVRGAWFVSQLAANALIAADKPGSIINIASIYGLRVGYNNSHYSVSKAAMIQMTKAFALELVSKNVRVNVVCPGYYRTELTSEFYDSPAGDRYIQKSIPSKRLGLLPELDGAMLLLASQASSNMTGSVITVDGGHSISSL